MKINRLLELLKVERTCVQRNHDALCNRDCENCDLVQNDFELIEAYDAVISIFENLNKGDRANEQSVV